MKPAELTVIQQAVLKHVPTLRLPPGARVLDAPCGGSAALTLALIEKGFHAIGADIDTKAETHLGNAFAKVDLNAVLPCPDQNFDAIFSTEGIEHLEMRPPKRMKRRAVRSRAAKRFRPFCNFCTSFLSSLVPDVSLLSARRFTSSYLGD